MPEYVVEDPEGVFTVVEVDNASDRPKGSDTLAAFIKKLEADEDLAGADAFGVDDAAPPGQQKKAEEK